VRPSRSRFGQRFHQAERGVGVGGGEGGGIGDGDGVEADLLASRAREVGENG